MHSTTSYKWSPLERRYLRALVPMLVLCFCVALILPWNFAWAFWMPVGIGVVGLVASIRRARRVLTVIPATEHPGTGRFEVVSTLKNSRSSPVMLVIEPWNAAELLQGNETFTIAAVSPSAGQLEVESSFGLIRVRCWNGATAKLVLEEQEVSHNFDVLDPRLQSELTTRTIMKILDAHIATPVSQNPRIPTATLLLSLTVTFALQLEVAVLLLHLFRKQPIDPAIHLMILGLAVIVSVVAARYGRRAWSEIIWRRRAGVQEHITWPQAAAVVVFVVCFGAIFGGVLMLLG